MNAKLIIAALASSFMLFVSAPTINAQGRGSVQQHQPRGDARGTHSRGGAPASTRSSHSSAAPKHSAPAPVHAPRAAAPVRHEPVHHHAAPVHHHAPAPVHHHAPAPVHHHAPAPVHHHFVPRHYGPRPVYHHHIDPRAHVFYIDNVAYYHWNGVYYNYVPSYGYQEIYMPENVIVAALPYGARVVNVNRINYYEANGMWFQPIDGGYHIVERPVANVTVALPRPTISFTASFGF